MDATWMAKPTIMRTYVFPNRWFQFTGNQSKWWLGPPMCLQFDSKYYNFLRRCHLSTEHILLRTHWMETISSWDMSAWRNQNLAVANILWLRYRCQRRCSGDFHICFNTRETELLLNVPCQDYYTRPQLLYRIDGTQGVACSQCSFQCGPKFIVTEVDVQNFIWEVGPLWGPTISLSAEPPSQLGLDAQKIS